MNTFPIVDLDIFEDEEKWNAICLMAIHRVGQGVGPRLIIAQSLNLLLYSSSANDY